MSASTRDASTQILTPTTDSTAIGAFWDKHTRPGGMYELRVLIKGRTGPLGLSGTPRGYFNNRQAVIDAVRQICGKDAVGVYLTLNEVDPALLKRAPNRLVSRATEATRDKDIVRRTRFLIDIDAANGSDESATEAQRAAALATRDKIEAHLHTVLGWCPARVVTCSGNGGGLIYAIDLPNDEAAKHLVKRALQALHARFSTPDATVDTANYNASRLTRVAGTVNGKGAHTEDRPWRIVDAEYLDELGVVSRSQLEALAALAPSKTRPAHDSGAAATPEGSQDRDYWVALLAQGAPSGERHHVMTRLVGHYVGLGIAPAEVKILLRPWVDRCRPTFDPRELDKVVDDLADAEARKRARGDDVPDLTPEVEDAPLTLSTPDKDTLIATQKAELADVKAQIKAWEHLYYINRAFPDKAKRVLVHMHKVFGVRIGQHLPDVMPCTLYPDEQKLQVDGFAISAYAEALDILCSLGLVTQEKRKKLKPGRGKDWYWEYGLNGPVVNALWQQLSTLTEIAPTARQIKAETSREERLQKAIAEEKPTLHVVRALKRDIDEERKGKEKVTMEAVALTFERNNARDALQEAQRIIQENQRQPAATARIMCRAGCGSFIKAAEWCCDECRERERDLADDSRLTSNLESSQQATQRTVTNWLTSNLESPAHPTSDDLKPCTGGCGTLTHRGWECKSCRLRSLRPLHVPDSTSARSEVSHGR